MICPRCENEFEGARSICPECGVLLLRNISGVIRTSAVLISAGKKSGVYRSVQEVPEPLRTQLILTTASPNSGTIVIADRAGKEQLTRVLAQRQSAAQSRARKAQQSMSAEEAALLDELLQNLAQSAEALSGENLPGGMLITEAATSVAGASRKSPGQTFAASALPDEAGMAGHQTGQILTGGYAPGASALEVFSRRASWLAWAGLVLVLLLAAVVSLLFGMRW